MNQRVVFNFLLVVFLLLCLATLAKVYLKKKSIRENFFFQATNNHHGTGISTTSLPYTTLAPMMSNEAKVLQQKYMEQINGLSNNINELKTQLSNYQSQTDILKTEVDTSKKEFEGEADKMKSSLQALGEFHDSYSQELQKALQTNLDYSDPVFQTNQEIQESRIKALEKQVSEIELLKMKVQNKKDSLLRSIICRANSTKLNVQPIPSGPNPTGKFVIFLNKGCLSYSESGSQVVVKVGGCDLSSGQQAFELQMIENFQDYNKAIKYEESSEKKMVLPSDDVYYPFYLVHPQGNYGKGLYIGDDNHLYVDTIRLDPHCRFRTSDVSAYGSCPMN